MNAASSKQLMKSFWKNFGNWAFAISIISSCGVISSAKPTLKAFDNAALITHSDVMHLLSCWVLLGLEFQWVKTNMISERIQRASGTLWTAIVGKHRLTLHLQMQVKTWPLEARAYINNIQKSNISGPGARLRRTDVKSLCRSEDFRSRLVFVDDGHGVVRAEEPKVHPDCRPSARETMCAWFLQLKCFSCGFLNQPVCWLLGRGGSGVRQQRKVIEIHCVCVCVWSLSSH